jgi:hypothetical protein
MMDEQERQRIRLRNIESPGAIERFSDFCSRQWRGLTRLFAGLPIGIPVAAAIVLAVVEAYMISVGFASLMGVWVAYASGAVLVGAFIWLTHELFVSLKTNEPLWEKLGWSAVVLVVFSVVTFSFFVTQVNNATFNYDEAAQRNAERASLNNEIHAGEIALRTLTVPTSYEGDKAALEATMAAGKRWGINEFSDCAREGGFKRQAPVDICTLWGELRVSILDAESVIEERKKVEADIAAAKLELESKPMIQGDAAWDAVAKLQKGEVSEARASTLALISAFMIWVTAFIWHKLIEHFAGRGRSKELKA